MSITAARMGDIATTGRVLIPQSLDGRSKVPRTEAIRASLRKDVPMAEKSPKKNTSKTAATKSLKEKRADKKSKASSKSTSA
jgi:hypothetical protein